MDKVRLSLEAPDGQRCVDVISLGDGGFAWVECRRDPEDSHGWRRLTAPVEGFGSESHAVVAAHSAVGWLGAGA